MEKHDPVISLLLEEKILDESSVNKLLDEHAASGKSLLNILKSRKLVDQNQFTKIVAVTNDIEFV